MSLASIRLRQLAAWVCLALGYQLATSLPAYALGEIQTAWRARYLESGVNLPTDCSGCHQNGITNQCTLNEYGRKLDELILDPIAGANTDCTNSDNINDYFNKVSGEIEGALDAAEPEFAPKVSGDRMVDDVPGDSPVTIDFDAGKTRDATLVSFKQIGKEMHEAGISVSTSAAAGSATITALLDLVTLGERRRSDPPQPFVVQFVPVNNHGFFPTTAPVRDTSEVEVIFANIAPEATGEGFTVVAGNVVTGNVLENDSDPDDAEDRLEAQLQTGPSVGELTKFQPNGDFEYTAPANITQKTVTEFTYRVVDIEGGTSGVVTATIEIAPPAANTAPNAAADCFIIEEDTALNGNVLVANPASALASPCDTAGVADSDPDADTLSIVSPPLNSNVATDLGSVRFLNAQGDFEYTPRANQTGADTFEYTITDGNGSSASATVTISVTPLNDPPEVLQPEVSIQLNESAPEQTFDLLGPDIVRDVDSPEDDLEVLDLQIGQSRLAVEPQPDGRTIKFDPSTLEEVLDNGESETVVITYTVSDGLETAAETVTLTITIIGLDNGAARIAGEYANTLRSRYNGHFLPSSVQNDSCHSCHNVGHVAVDIDDVSDCTAEILNPFGLAICLDRNPGDPPLVDLVRRLRDREPEFAPRLTSGPNFVVPETAEIGDPVGTSLAEITRPGKTVSGNTAQIHSYGIINSAGVPAEIDDAGLFRVEPNGQIRVAGDLTPGTFELTIVPINDAGQLDNEGNLRSGIPGFFPVDPSLLTVTSITVLEAGAPVAVDDSVNTQQGTPVQIDVTANDEGGTATQVTIESDPANGSAVVDADNLITYTPDPGFFGLDEFAYGAANAANPGAPSVATVQVKVVQAQGALAVPDSARTIKGEPVTIDVLANDLGLRPITVTVVSEPTPDSTAVTPDGDVIYTPPADFVGEAKIRYQAANGIDSSQALITVTVATFSGELFENATDNPALKPVARALGDSCVRLESSSSAPTPDQADLLTICDLIGADVQSGENVDQAFAAIRNEEMLAVGEVASRLGRVAGSAISSRLGRIRGGGGRGFDMSGMNVSLGSEALPGDIFGQIAQHLMGQDASGAEMESSASMPWGTFIAGEVSIVDHDATGRESGYDLSSVAVTAGVDYMFDEMTILGIAGSYAFSSTDFGSGGIDAQSFQASVYGARENFGVKGLQLSGLFSYGHDEYESERVIRFTANNVPIDRTAEADFAGYHVNAVMRLEYDVTQLSRDEAEHARATQGTFGPADFRVFGEVDYLHGHIDSYVERGAQGLNLAVAAQSFDSLIGTVGVHLGVPVRMEAGEITPFVSVAGNSEFMDGRDSITASFASVGADAPSFVVSGDDEDHLFATVRLGMDGEFLGAGLRLEYETEFGRSDFSEHRFSAFLGGPILGQDRFGFEFSSNLSDIDAGPQLGLSYELRF